MDGAAVGAGVAALEIMNGTRERIVVLPTFLITGAERAGTTALFQFLRQHPNVCFSRPKETWFFNRRYDRGIDWFASHFEHYEGETAVG